MKKIISAVLAMVLCLGVFAGCSNNKVAPWDVSDFSFYDSSNNELGNPKNGGSVDMLEQAKKSDVQTKRGIKIGDEVTLLLSKYNLDGFHYTIYMTPGNTGKEDLASYKNKEFHEKYPSFSEALSQATLINKTGLSLSGNMRFYVKDGKLIPYDLDENGAAKDKLPQYETYSLVFMILDGKIYDVSFFYDKSN